MSCSNVTSVFTRVISGLIWKEKLSRVCCCTTLQQHAKVNFSQYKRTFYQNQNSYSSSASSKSKKFDCSDVPSLKEFLSSSKSVDITSPVDEIRPPYLENAKYSLPPNGKTVYFEMYGCQMNVNDAEYAWAILKNVGYKRVDTYEKVK